MLYTSQSAFNMPCCVWGLAVTLAVPCSFALLGATCLQDENCVAGHSTYTVIMHLAECMHGGPELSWLQIAQDHFGGIVP